MVEPKKIKVGIIGTGNIGTDLLYKVQRSPFLVCGMFAGRNADSEGIARARQMGVLTSTDSCSALVNDPECCEIVFDATTAQSHYEHAPILERLGKFTLDLTPAKVGTMCIPVLNLGAALETRNVNLVTCGGQTTVPMACAIMQVHPETEYIEVVGSIASFSAGQGTRSNIEEYLQTTTEALKNFSGVPRAKAILILNPAEPPILMHNTIYASIPYPDLGRLKEAVDAMAKKVQEYVPGYRVIMGPTLDKGRVVVTVEVKGRGDFLPTYAGNLDVITCAAVKVAEEYAKKKLFSI